MLPRPALATLLGLLAGCASDPPTNARTLEGAFERVATAIDAGDARRLYWDLELETRWTLMSIHRNQQRIRRLVDEDYPVEERSRASGRWSLGARAKDPGELFAQWCAARDCLAPLREKIGAVARLERQDAGGSVHTVRGGRYGFRKGADGRFGLLGFEEQVKAWGREVDRDLKVIERTAAQYRNADLALKKGG